MPLYLASVSCSERMAKKLSSVVDLFTGKHFYVMIIHANPMRAVASRNGRLKSPMQKRDGCGRVETKSLNSHDYAVSHTWAKEHTPNRVHSAGCVDRAFAAYGTREASQI